MPSSELLRSILSLEILGAILAGGWVARLEAQERFSVSRGANSESVRIDHPNVTQPSTVYSTVRFRPGDHWKISAGGCVQTGGSGRTWKRYVDPSGDNSNRLYYGVVDVMDGGAMKPIREVRGQDLIVPAGLDTTQAVLKLGYVDDDYGDNGYDRPDDGTEDQCKGVGPAFVNVEIARRAPLVIARDPIRAVIRARLPTLTNVPANPSPAPAPATEPPPITPPPVGPASSAQLRLTVSVSPTTILGFGFASARAVFIASGISPAESVRVVVRTLHSYVSPEIVTVSANAPGVATIRSDGLHGDTLFAILGALPPSAVALLYVFPTSFLIFGVVGSLVGATLDWTQYKKRRSTTASGKAFLGAILSGLLLAVAVCGLGFTIVGLTLAATTGQLLVLFIAAMGSWGGPKLLARLFPQFMGQ